MFMLKGKDYEISYNSSGENSDNNRIAIVSTSLYSLISLVRPFSSISPNGLLVSGHLQRENFRFKMLTLYNTLVDVAIF